MSPKASGSSNERPITSASEREFTVFLFPIPVCGSRAQRNDAVILSEPSPLRNLTPTGGSVRIVAHVEEAFSAPRVSGRDLEADRLTRARQLLYSTRRLNI